LVDEVLVALPLKEEKTILELVEKCEHEGIRARVVPDFFKVIRNRPELGSIGDIPVLSIRTEPLDLLRNRALKRAFDIIFSLTTLLLLSPVFLVLAVLIKLTSPGPVFFKQKRVGANNVEFEIYKFRSMRVQEKEQSDTIWTTEDDPRVTWIGKFMRKNNLDELPQFWNVFNGHMSIVGPRPEREYFVEKFKEDIPNYKVRHLVKSGITGWAQVNGWRGDTSIEKRVEHDVYYLENWSFLLDLKIIWRTVFSRQTQQHAY
jgi:Undecaprenyl-phosphate glucose phosphotransferase